MKIRHAARMQLSVYPSVSGLTFATPQIVTVHNDHTVKVCDVGWLRVCGTTAGSDSVGAAPPQIWDVTTPDDFPIANLTEHQEEVVAVDWNGIDKSLFVTGSWDNTAKVHLSSAGVMAVLA